MSNLLRHRLPRRCLREVFLLITLFAAAGCAAGYRVAPAATAYSHQQLGVHWLSPAQTADRSSLARWRAAVGGPLVVAGSRTGSSRSSIDELTIVSWNIALGGGDVRKLVQSLRAERPDRPIVLLLQEAFRDGDDVPVSPINSAFASRISAVADREIEHVARELDLSMYYVPSMRNGSPGRFNQDRGNAILSTEPLEGLMAIELPFERQRRVATAATIRGVTSAGRPWSLRLASVHLDNRSGASRAWLGSEYARTRQARAVRDALAGTEPLVLGGDFNTWFGFSDAAYRETVRAFPQTVITDPRRTFLGVMRLDHVFYRLPAGWRAHVRRGESSLGSDHHPLITTVSFGG